MRPIKKTIDYTTTTRVQLLQNKNEKTAAKFITYWYKIGRRPFWKVRRGRRRNVCYRIAIKKDLRVLKMAHDCEE